MPFSRRKTFLRQQSWQTHGDALVAVLVILGAALLAYDFVDLLILITKLFY